MEVARVEVIRLTDEAQAVGSLRSRQSVVLRPEVSGRVTQLNFRDGDRVRRGQLLVQLDDQLPLAQVQQSQAELSIAQANHKRNQELVAQNFISQRSVDESAANLEVAQAKLSLARATAARLRIVAPFDGIAGIRNISVGDYLKDGADIVNIEDMDAIYVDFRLPERLQTKLQQGPERVGRHRRAARPQVRGADPGDRSAGGRQRPLHRGPGLHRQPAICNCAPACSPASRPCSASATTRGRSPRKRSCRRPGASSCIRLVDGPDQDTRIAQRVEVKVGIRRPGRVEIIEGLQPGDMVVTAGQQRVQKDGMPVRVLELGGKSGAGPSGAPMACPWRARRRLRTPVRPRLGLFRWRRPDRWLQNRKGAIPVASPRPMPARPAPCDRRRRDCPLSGTWRPFHAAS